MKTWNLEVWFGLNSGQTSRASSYYARVRFEGRAELHGARFVFDGGWAHAAKMVHTLVWFREPGEALVDVVPAMRFDVLEGDRVVAKGRVHTR